MSAKTKVKAGLVRTPVLEFKSRRGWEAWLALNHRQAGGAWLRLHQKTARKPGMTYVEALHGALCYGWMEGRKKLQDQQSWLQQFKPRSLRSRWSSLHAENAERLIKTGRMRPAGLKAIRAAKADGRWRLAYDPPGSARIPLDLIQALTGDRNAHAFFKGLSKGDTYAIAYHLQAARDAKLRARRLQSIVAQLAKGVRPFGEAR